MVPFRHHLQQAFRGVRQASVPSFLAVLTLTLGLGAASSLCSLLDALLLHPVPYAEPDRLVAVWRTLPGYDRAQFNGSQFGALAAAAQVLPETGALGLGGTTLLTPEGPVPVRGIRVSGGLLPLLRIKPALGRVGFTAEEDRLGGPGVVILSHRFWRNRLGADPGILSRSLVIGGRGRQVVGVLPPDFVPPTARAGHPDLCLPIGFRPEELVPEAGVDYEVVGRLRDGVTLAQTNEALRGLASATEGRGLGLRAVPLGEDRSRPYRSRLLLMGAAVALLLMVACANASALLLARLADRQGVLALQGALGAPPRLLGLQVALEGLGFGLLGAGGGLLLEGPLRGFMATQLGLALVPARPPWTFPAALALGLATGVGASAFPALRAMTVPPAQALRDLASHASPRTGARRVLVAVEVALSFVLLAGAAMLLSNLWGQLRRGSGFDTQGVSVCSVALPQDRQAMAGCWAGELAERLRAAPGMTGACVGLSTPMWDAGGSWSVNAAGQDRSVETWVHRMEGDVVGALGLHLLAGRKALPGERDGAVVSRQLAERLWPGEAPLGRRLEVGGNTRTVVGVVEGTREYDLGEPLRPQVFEGLAEGPELPSLDIILRSRADAATVRGQVRAALAASDPALGAGDPRPFEEVISALTEPERHSAYPLAALGIAAALLSSLGLYGLLRQTFRMRRPELGVRSALGAGPARLFRLVLEQGLRILMWGLGFGMLAGAGLFRLLSHGVPGLGTLDLACLLAALLLLSLTTLLASLGPALHASRTDPAESIRES